MTAWEILAQIKGTLALVDGIATCAIGLEANITPSDYPLIRIVPTRLIPKDEVGNRALIELTLYFGDALLESADGLEAVYQRLLALESEIGLEVLFGAAWVDGHRLSARFIDTLFDEDRLPHYKMMASRFEVEG
jgi:hypothetical protein